MTQIKNCLEESDMTNIIEKATDMNEVKGIAEFLLNLSFVKTEYWPLVVQHPFTNSGYFSYRDEQGDWKGGELEEGTPTYEAFIAQKKELIKQASSPSALASWINKPWRAFFADMISVFCSPKDLSPVVQMALLETEYLNCDKNCSPADLIRLTKACDKKVLMGDDYEAYEALPETVKVYRGVTSFNEKNNKAISWTTDFETAKWFAKRYNSMSTGKVFSAEIPKKHLLAYFSYENTAILEPRYLKNIMVVAEYEMNCIEQ